jgi:hypothetical protein
LLIVRPPGSARLKNTDNHSDRELFTIAFFAAVTASAKPQPTN